MNIHKYFLSFRETLLIILFVSIAFLYLDLNSDKNNESPYIDKNGNISCRSIEPIVHRVLLMHPAGRDAELRKTRFSRFNLIQYAKSGMADKLDSYKEYFLNQELDSFLLDKEFDNVNMAVEVFIDGKCSGFEKFYKTYEVGLHRWNGLVTDWFNSNEEAELVSYVNKKLNEIQDKKRGDEIQESLSKWPNSVDDIMIKARWKLVLNFRDLKDERKNLDDLSILRLAKKQILIDWNDQIEELKGGVSSVVLQLMLNEIDPHSNYFSNDEFRKFWDGHNSQYAGLGIRVEPELNGFRVKELIPDGPSMLSKLLVPDSKNGRGDILTRIVAVENSADDDIELEVKNESDHKIKTRWSQLNLKLDNLSLKKLTSYLRGTPGTRVILELDREGVEEPLLVTLTRGLVSQKLDLIKTEIISDQSTGDKFGYLKLDKFYGSHLYDDFQLKSKSLIDSGLNGLLLDLRDNPGGDLGEALKIANLFLGEKPLLIDFSLNDQSYRAHWGQGPEQITGPLVILLNDKSASASEILAGTLQSYHKAMVVGSSSSFGKGSIQSISSMDQLFPWGKGLGGMKITTSFYFLPNGQPIQGKGVEPDILLTSPEMKNCYKSQKDLKSGLPRPEPLNFDGLNETLDKGLLMSKVDKMELSERIKRNINLKSIQKQHSKCDEKSNTNLAKNDWEKSAAIQTLKQFSIWWSKRNQVASYNTNSIK